MAKAKKKANNKTVKKPETKMKKRRELTDEDFDPKNVKFRTTIWFDLDVIQAAQKATGRPDGRGWQSVINAKLREILGLNVSVPENCSVEDYSKILAGTATQINALKSLLKSVQEKIEGKVERRSGVERRVG